MVVEEEIEMCHILNNNENQCVLYILVNTLQRSMDCQLVLCVCGSQFNVTWTCVDLTVLIKRGALVMLECISSVIR